MSHLLGFDLLFKLDSELLALSLIIHLMVADKSETKATIGISSNRHAKAPMADMPNSVSNTEYLPVFEQMYCPSKNVQSITAPTGMMNKTIKNKTTCIIEGDCPSNLIIPILSNNKKRKYTPSGRSKTGMVKTTV
jgi:hypothetical protein